MMNTTIEYIVNEKEITSLSDTQEKVLSLLPILPAALSLFGSATIISMVVSSKKVTPYKRLLFGMSVCDCIMSLSVPCWAFLLPQETSQRVWAFGNDTTCTVIGFFAQFAFSGIIYNGLLTYYFLLTVRFGWREDAFAKCVEPLMHLLAVGYPLITATMGAILGMFHESELGQICWITDYPKNCGDDPGESGEECLGSLFAWIFGGTVIFTMIVSIAVNNIVIFCFVRQTISRGRRRSSSFTATPNNSGMRRSGGGDGTDSQTKRIRAVATQGFLYVGAFLMSYSWTIVMKVMEGTSYNANDEDTLFPLLVIQALFMPMQGFFNLLVYVRPNYLRNRRDFPNQTRFWTFRRAIYGNGIQPQQQDQRNERRHNNKQQDHAQRSSRRMWISTAAIFVRGSPGGDSAGHTVSGTSKVEEDNHLSHQMSRLGDDFVQDRDAIITPTRNDYGEGEQADQDGTNNTCHRETTHDGTGYEH